MNIKSCIFAIVSVSRYAIQPPYGKLNINCSLESLSAVQGSHETQVTLPQKHINLRSAPRYSIYNHNCFIVLKLLMIL